MHSESSDNELLSLRQKVESLSTLLGTLHQESNQTIDKLELRLQDQQTLNANIVKLLEEKGLASQLPSTGVTYVSSTQLVHEPDDTVDVKINTEIPHPKSNQSASDSSSTGCIKTSSCTQTNLAIDPETSIKLSFISAGISSYGSSIEYSSGKNTITSTPASFNRYRSQSHYSTQSNGRVFQTSTDRMTPTSLNKDFSDRHSETQESSREPDDIHKVDKQHGGGAGRPPTFPSAGNTPSKQSPQTQAATGSAGSTGSAPLKSILRTPTHEKKPSPGGPLSSFSPSLSPIQSLLTTSAMGGNRNDPDTTSPSIFDDSHIEHDNKDDDLHINQGTHRDHTVDLSASLFMSPLHYDSSDADGSLQSLSLLNVTSNTTLASGVGTGSPQQHGRDRATHSKSNHYSYASRVSRKKKSPLRRRRKSGDNISEDQSYRYRDGSFDSRSGTSGDEARTQVFVGEGGDAPGGNPAYHTPTKDRTHNSAASSVNHSAHTTGYNKKRVNAMGYVKLQHFSESKRTSGFWKERLGKRDLTSVLSSPLSQKLF